MHARRAVIIAAVTQPAEKRTTIDELERRWREVLEEIVSHGVVYRVVAPVPEGTGLFPSGMVTGPESVAFVLGPQEICGQVLGLVDAEYGWPAPVRLEDIRSAWDLAPGPRRHPFIAVGNRAVVGIMESEYEQILAMQPRDPPPGGPGAPAFRAADR